MNPKFTKCLRCKEILSRDKFKGADSICIECKEKERNYKKCGRCEKSKRIDEEIKRRGIFCFQCKDEKDKEWRLAHRKTNVVRQCIGCGNDVKVKKARATIIYCKSCKKKKEDIRKENIKRELNRKIYRKCHACGKKEEVENREIPATYTCLDCKESPNYDITKKYIRHCKICEGEIITHKKLSTFLICDDCEKIKDNYKIYKRDGRSYRICFKCENEFELSPKSRKYKCDDCRKIKEEIRPKFARKKHFGYYGIASDGHRWDSLCEQDIEEWLIHNFVRHRPHPRLGNSQRHADQYLDDFDFYLEIDGFDRKDDIDWYGKLSLYKKLKLNYKIIKPPSVHFYEDKEKCFEELNKIFVEILI